tara:strand:- start:45 stop:770 length:726 start_codon:yes stop_codon:yes gene_type:complete
MKKLNLYDLKQVLEEAFKLDDDKDLKGLNKLAKEIYQEIKKKALDDREPIDQLNLLKAQHEIQEIIKLYQINDSKISLDSNKTNINEHDPKDNTFSIENDYYIDYIDRKGHESSRLISPIRIFDYKNKSYIEAYCHLREDIRNFGIESIAHIRETGPKSVKKDSSYAENNWSDFFDDTEENQNDSIERYDPFKEIEKKQEEEEREIERKKIREYEQKKQEKFNVGCWAIFFGIFLLLLLFN